MSVLGLILGVLTTYTAGMFHTEVEVQSRVDYAACMEVVDSMVLQMQTEPRKLAEWAFAGLGEQKEEKKNALMLVWKDGEYVPERHYAKVIFDIKVNGLTMFRNVAMECVVTDSVKANARDVRVDIYYSGSLLKEAYGYFRLEPQRNTVRMKMDIHVRFGWFFNLFISQRRYSETIDWRVERFVQNIRLKSEGVRPSDGYWKAF